MSSSEKILDSRERGNLTAAAGLPTEPVPLEPYRSADFFAMEKEQVFRRAWLLMARVEELPEPGSFVTKSIPNLGVSVIITRSKSEKVKAFYNTCSHRGSQIVSETSGRRARFICPYHHWTYSNEGSLLGVPDEENFFFDKSKCGLTSIATDVWEGWVFINLQPDPEVKLDEYLGDLKDYLKGFYYLGADNPVVFTAELNANWKVVFDAFIESYHIPAIHPRTIASTFSSSENPHARLLFAKLLGTHQAVSMFGNSEYTLNPKNKVEQLGASGGEAGSVISAANKEQAERLLAHPSVNPTKNKNWSMDVVQVFPHVQIDCGPGGFWVHHFWPLTENTSYYEGRFYMEEAVNMRQRFLQELYVGRVIEVLLEDLVNVRRTQKGIDTRGKDFMQLQDSEIGIRHSTSQVIKWVNSKSIKEALS